MKFSDWMLDHQHRRVPKWSMNHSIKLHTVPLAKHRFAHRLVQRVAAQQQQPAMRILTVF